MQHRISWVNCDPFSPNHHHQLRAERRRGTSIVSESW